MAGDSELAGEGGGLKALWVVIIYTTRPLEIVGELVLAALIATIVLTFVLMTWNQIETLLRLRCLLIIAPAGRLTVVKFYFSTVS